MKTKNKADYGQEMAPLLTILSISSIALIFIGTSARISHTLSIIVYSINGFLAVLVIVGVWSSRVAHYSLGTKFSQNSN